MAQMKRWAVGLVLCFLLVASKASATYVVIENISPSAPNWGGCNCIRATGWLGFITMGFTVVESDGTTQDLILLSSDYGTRADLALAHGNFFLLDITKKNPVAPGDSRTSKKIIGLPDTGFRFSSRGADIGVYYCEACQDICGGYGTGNTNVYPDGLFIIPGLAGSNSFEFRCPTHRITITVSCASRFIRAIRRHEARSKREGNNRSTSGGTIWRKGPRPAVSWMTCGGELVLPSSQAVEPLTSAAARDFSRAVARRVPSDGPWRGYEPVSAELPSQLQVPAATNRGHVQRPGRGAFRRATSSQGPDDSPAGPLQTAGFY
jgi:hypothetical protein